MEVLVGAVVAIGEVVVHHDVDALDVDATSEEVGGHQNALLEVLELLVAVCPEGYATTSYRIGR